MRDLLGIKPVVIHDEYNLSDEPVDILTFDNIFIETDIAHAMIFRSNRWGIIHNFTMAVDPGYNYLQNFCGGIQWYMMEWKDFISCIRFELKTENGNFVSFRGQNITFRSSVKEVWIVFSW